MAPRPEVAGFEVDAQTRCAHWRSARDVVAIKMKCCGVYYACKDCHEALADHAIQTWPSGEWNEKAVLCGVCGAELTVLQYLDCGDHCPGCGVAFNPGCRHHRRFYLDCA